jgi:hypothetical protein
MTFIKSKRDKLIAQQQRLLQEFPWLWRITDTWYLGCHEIIVKAGNQDALDELGIHLYQKPIERVAYWLFLTRGKASMHVVRIESFDAQKSLGRNIYEHLQPDGYMLCNILMVEHSALGQKNQHTIFRARKKSPRDLHQMVCKCSD